MMRLRPIPVDELSSQQLELHRSMSEVIDAQFGDLIVRRSDGALLGPFNGWLHYPQFGTPAWHLNRALWTHSVLPAAIHQLVILVTAAKFGARYEMNGHEYFGARAGLPADTIATIASGERLTDLPPDERVAYDMAAALNRGGALPESTYRAAVVRLGDAGTAEIAFLVGCFSLVGITLNAFDASIPGREEDYF